MSVADIILRAAAINALYSGKFFLCECGRGATYEDSFKSPLCTHHGLDRTDTTPLPQADVAGQLNSMAWPL